MHFLTSLALVVIDAVLGHTSARLTITTALGEISDHSTPLVVDCRTVRATPDFYSTIESDSRGGLNNHASKRAEANPGQEVSAAPLLPLTGSTQHLHGRNLIDTSLTIPQRNINGCALSYSTTLDNRALVGPTALVNESTELTQGDVVYFGMELLGDSEGGTYALVIADKAMDSNPTAYPMELGASMFVTVAPVTLSADISSLIIYAIDTTTSGYTLQIKNDDGSFTIVDSIVGDSITTGNLYDEWNGNFYLEAD